MNNAGVRGNQFYDDLLVLEDYKEVWEVNIMGGIRVCQAFKQLIKKSKFVSFLYGFNRYFIKNKRGWWMKKNTFANQTNPNP